MSSRPGPRRNVKNRNRNGCITCRARRLKCDEKKPECNNCTRLSLPCRGYTPQIIFKDQTASFNSPRRTRSSQKLLDSTTASARENVADNGIDTHIGDSFADACPDADVTSVPNLESHATESRNPVYSVGLQGISPNAAACFPDTNVPEGFNSGLVSDADSEFPTSANEDNETSSHHTSPITASRQDFDSLFAPPDASDPLLAPVTPRCDSIDQFGTQVFLGIKTAPIIPHGLLKSTKYPEDMLYYHHLRDTSPYGVLSVLYLNDLVDVHYLDRSTYHAALALSALKISKHSVESELRSQAGVHALEHYVTALEIIRNQVDDDDDDAALATPGKSHNTAQGERAVSWLSAVLFLASFEMQRGQIRLWYAHSRAAIDFLSPRLSSVLATRIGESLVRAISRTSALLDIYERTHSLQNRVMSSPFSKSLIRSLATSTIPYDRLHFILPRLHELEEEWRTTLRLDDAWDERVDGLRMELECWRESLPTGDIPAFDDEEVSDNVQPRAASFIDIKPVTILSSREPVRAGTNFAHYLVSILRLDLMYSAKKGKQFTDAEFAAIIHKICRLAVGLPRTLCAIVNLYGHGILPVMIDAYHMSDSNMGDWIRKWVASLPDKREGIWDINRVQRLLRYLDEEYNQGPRPGWTIIKTRMVDLGRHLENRQPDVQESQADSFCVEIYLKGKRGWSIDFVEIELA